MAKDKGNTKTKGVEATITPSQYFEYLKGSKNTITTEALKASYDSFIQLGEKYRKVGQLESLKKLCFLADVLKKEERLIELGINTFIYKDVVEEYITSVANKTVKIVELSRYMREIPDELVETIEKSKSLFDEFYVVFTDYTGKEERKVEKERRDKDPILFGVFKNGGNVSDRFYFLGDWVDEYCDLTLDKLVDEYTKKKGVSPAMTTAIPKDTDELIETLRSYKESASKEKKPLSHSNNLYVENYAMTNETKKPRFFDRIRSIFKSEK